MAFEIWNNSTQYSEFIVLLIFTPTSIAITILRFMAIRSGIRKPGFEDWMAIVATLFAVLTNLAGLMAISILNGRQIATELAENPSDFSRMRKWDMAGLYFYFGHSFFVKLSVLALYHRIFGIYQIYKICIYILGALQAALLVALCIFQGLQCEPFDKYFDLLLPGTCYDEGLIILSSEVPNSFIDFAMVTLAILMIQPRQLPSITKWKLTFLFGLGALVGLIGIIKIILNYSTNTLYAFSMIALWTGVQQFAALMCCSLPVFHPLVLKWTAGFRQISSRIINYASSGRASHDRTGTDTAKSSRKRSELDSVGKHQPGWRYLTEDNNTNFLAWPEATHHAETHVLSNFPDQGTHPESLGIRVQRDFDLV